MRPSKKFSTPKVVNYTHEGAKAKNITPMSQLRRTVLSHLLFEDNFYEDGVSAATRLEEEAKKVTEGDLASLAIEARTAHNLRHVPLVLAVELVSRGSPLVEQTLASICQRPDEPGQFLSLYWKGEKKPIPHSVRRGLSDAIRNYDEYQIAKWGRGNPSIRDVLRLCHPVPRTVEEKQLWRKVVKNELETPDTWEVQLSAGKDKKETFTRLLQEGKLGDLAFLRNLRNMKQAGVEKEIVAKSMSHRRFNRVLPFRFLAASRACPEWEDVIDQGMLNIRPEFKLSGHTIILVDVSGSMNQKLSSKSDITREDAASGIAILAREMCDSVSIYTFSNSCVQVPPRRGMSLRDAIKTSQPNTGTYLAGALLEISNREDVDNSRIIIITDEQTADRPDFVGRQRYVINVAPYQNGVGYGDVVHVDGFSEQTLKFIYEYEVLNQN